jgi:hypothetical protein
MFKWARKTAVLVQSGDQGDLDTKKRASLRNSAQGAREHEASLRALLTLHLLRNSVPLPHYTRRPQRHQGRLQHAHEDADLLVQDLL